jgi:hypothetical protein
MNLREGTRRLALLLGVVGAIAGLFVSYLEVQSISTEKANHAKFERLATSDVVEQTRKTQAGWSTIDPKTGERVEWDQEIGKGGIKTIHWTTDSAIAFIVTDDGNFVFLTAAPSVWEYLLVVFYPILGFVIPYGLVRAVGWVAVGFVASAK